MPRRRVGSKGVPSAQREQKRTIRQNEQQATCQNENNGMKQVIEKIGAGEGNRTLVISLEGCLQALQNQRYLDFSVAQNPAFPQEVYTPAALQEMKELVRGRFVRRRRRSSRASHMV
ncbi:MAG: hypothetical protein WBW73_08560 [Rhodoplanes sp.]